MQFEHRYRFKRLGFSPPEFKLQKGLLKDREDLNVVKPETGPSLKT